MAQLDDRQQKIKDTFVRNRRCWTDIWEEVLQLTSVLGMHTVSEGVPVLIQEAKSAGITS